MKNERIVSTQTDTAVLTNGKPFEIVDTVVEYDTGFYTATKNGSPDTRLVDRNGTEINDGDTVVFDAKSCVPRGTLTCKYDEYFGWVLTKGKELIYVGSTLWKHPMNWDAQGRWFLDGTVKSKESKK